MRCSDAVVLAGAARYVVPLGVGREKPHPPGSGGPRGRGLGGCSEERRARRLGVEFVHGARRSAGDEQCGGRGAVLGCWGASSEARRRAARRRERLREGVLMGMRLCRAAL